MLRVFYYDIQAVVDSFIVMLLRDFGLDTSTIRVQSLSQDLTEYLGDIRRLFADAINSSIDASDEILRGVVESQGDDRPDAAGSKSNCLRD